MLIRAATPNDIPSIRAIYAPEVLHGTASAETVPPDENEMLARFTKVTQAGYPYFVAEVEGKILGYAYAGAYHTRAGYKSTCEDSIYIAKEAQGQGVGLALLESLLDACTRLNLLQMMAVIGGSENKGSIRLHEKCGFKIVGHAKNLYWKQNRWVDLILMQKELGEGAKNPPHVKVK